MRRYMLFSFLMLFYFVSSHAVQHLERCLAFVRWFLKQSSSDILIWMLSCYKFLSLFLINQLFLFFRNYCIYRTINPISTGWKTGFSLQKILFLSFPSALFYALVMITAIFCSWKCSNSICGVMLVFCQITVQKNLAILPLWSRETSQVPPLCHGSRERFTFDLMHYCTSAIKIKAAYSAVTCHLILTLFEFSTQ